MKMIIKLDALCNADFDTIRNKHGALFIIHFVIIPVEDGPLFGISSVIIVHVKKPVDGKIFFAIILAGKGK